MKNLKYSFLIMLFLFVVVCTIPFFGMFGFYVGKVFFNMSDDGATGIGIIGLIIGIPIEFQLIKILQKIN